jgi:type VI secretion system secreted protein Hcp
MAIYMEYEGIKGNVTAAGYEGMIKLDFVQFGVQRAVSMKTGTMANRAHALPKFSIVKTGKKLERSTPLVTQETYAGGAGKQVKLHFVRTGQGRLEETMTYTLENCLPTYYRLVATKREGCVPVERLYLSYSAIEISQTVTGANNKGLSTLRVGYDLATAKRL